jgi:hypothetical protein
LKQELEIVSIDAGREIDSSDEQPSNADLSRPEIVQPVSNAKVERLSQFLKQELEIV